MKNTIKTALFFSLPMLALVAVFNIGILQTIREAKTYRGPAIENKTHTMKIVSL